MPTAESQFPELLNQNLARMWTQVPLRLPMLQSPLACTTMAEVWTLKPWLKPLLSRITMPILDFFYSLKVASSQFIFTTPWVGGRHLAQVAVRSGRGMDGTYWVSANSVTCSFADDAIWWTLMLGLLKRTWFFWVLISHTEVENSSKLWSLVMSHESSPLKSTKVFLLQLCPSVSSSQNHV